MGKCGNFLKAERCGAALERVRGTENGIDQFRIGSAGVELQQCRLHRVQTFQTFIEERQVEMAEINLAPGIKIGRASWREGVCQQVSIWVGAVYLKEKKE